MRNLLALNILVTLCAILLCGCYADRMTNQFNSAFGNTESDNAVLEESELDEETKRRRREELVRIANEDAPAYRMNSGDKISISVYGHDDLGITTKISPDGTVGMLFLGQVKLSGRTIIEARDEIERGLTPYVKHPVVGVTVLEVASETVTISGAVNSPGMYGISASTRLADAYAMAGGTAHRLLHGDEVDTANLDDSIIIRDGKLLPVDMRAAIERGDKLHNIRLHKDDYIYIMPRLEASLTVCGEVSNPTRRFFEPGIGILEALTDAGWMKETHWSHVIIIRNGLVNPKLYKIDIDGILVGKCKNILLKANDIIYVPKDNLSEYNVFVRKLMPTAQLFNLLSGKKAIMND